MEDLEVRPALIYNVICISEKVLYTVQGGCKTRTPSGSKKN